MSLFVLNPPRAAAAPVRVVERCTRWLANYLGRREAIKALSLLDERELKDIGLSRGRIEAAVNGFVQAEAELGRVR